jgi:hypothetical protein
MMVGSQLSVVSGHLSSFNYDNQDLLVSREYEIVLRENTEA